MIYIDTPRQFWRTPATFIRMGGTVAVGALIPVAPLAAAIILTAKAVFEWRQSRINTPSAHLLTTKLFLLLKTRITLFIICLPINLTNMVKNPAAVWIIFEVWLVGEILERALYFRAVDAAKMPGVAAP